MRIILALLLSTLAAVAADLTHAVPADTTIVVRADLPQVRNSMIMTKIIDRNFERYTSLLESVQTTMGINLEDVDTVWLMAVKMNHGAIILDGKIPTNAVRTRADAAAAEHDHVVISSRDDFPLVVNYVDKKADMTLAVKDNRAIIGNRKYVAQLFDSLLGVGESVGDNPLLAKLSASKDPVAMAMLAMNDDLASRNRDLATMVQSGYASFDLTETVSANLEINAANADQADGLHMIAQGMIALQAAQLQQMQAAPENFSASQIRKATVMSEVLKTARLSRQNTTVTCQWTMSKDAQKLIGETAKSELPTNIAVP